MQWRRGQALAPIMALRLPVPADRLAAEPLRADGPPGAAAQTPREVSTIFTVRSRIERSSQRLQLAM